MRLRNTIRSFFQGDWNTQRIRRREVPAMMLAAVLLAGAGQVRAQFIFGEPENLGPVVNSPGPDWGPGISADGLTLYYAAWEVPAQSSADLVMTTRVSTSDPWQPPVNLGPTVNCVAYVDGAPSISDDGLTLYFTSTRPGGLGWNDIWITTRASTSDPWQEPSNLSVLNTSTWDGSPDISADGLTLLFSSLKSGGYGSNDLYMSTRSEPSDPWNPPVNLGPPVNSAAAEWSPSLSTDGLTLFFQSNRPGGLGGWDMYASTRPTPSDPWGTPLNLGPQVNTVLHEGQLDISADGTTLFFVSPRPGGFGEADIWQVMVNDCNSNGMTDACDIDCGEPGGPCDLPDCGQSQDCNANGIPDECIAHEDDCNSNDTPDACDITDGTSEDCNDNGVPDECIDLEDDCNTNLTPDTCDIAGGTSDDCNGNGIPDECIELEDDCNSNLTPDSCDIAGGTSDDCNGNSVPDECDIADGSAADCNGNAVPDECDLAAGTSEDCNGNGVPDECPEDPSPEITLHPVSQEVEPGAMVVFNVAATGILLEYQWRKDGEELTDTERIIGCTESLLGILIVEPADAGEYDCVVTDFDGCSVTSDVAVLTVTGACPADLNGDGAVDAADLANLLGAWGPQAGHPADFNGDDLIGAGDLAILLGAWGPC